MRDGVGKFGSLGAILTAALCPICFPKLALLGAFFGLGFLTKYETVFFFTAQIFVLAILIASIINYRRYKNRMLLMLVVMSAILFMSSLYIYVNEIASYVALGGLLIASIWTVFESRRCSNCDVPGDRVT